MEIPESAIVFLSVGSLIPRKNPLDVIEGFQATDIEDGVLLMLGDGPLQAECESLAADDDRVRIEGWVDNVSEYLGASDYFVLASSSEGFPNTVMEALAVGLPVVLSDIQPHQEILQHDADAGIEFELRDTRSLAVAMERITTREYTAQNAAARVLALDNLNSNEMSKQYLDLYEHIIEVQE
ncbi:glycosyltransferase [Natrinema pallidum]|uniref:glycosyltransferase n=1 Tax=Natrinema pallidum TaxID=69527 RepID=UPI000AA3681E|nr:glycosyltransferase [Natrinema pallidum]